jgi:hypothetical protein
MGLNLPKVGKKVVTPQGDARVVKLDILQGLVTVRTEDGTYETFKGSDVKRKFGPGGQPVEPDDAPEPDHPEPEEGVEEGN